MTTANQRFFWFLGGGGSPNPVTDPSFTDPLIGTLYPIVDTVPEKTDAGIIVPTTQWAEGGRRADQ